jgi:hypothetical protein
MPDPTETSNLRDQVDASVGTLDSLGAPLELMKRARARAAAILTLIRALEAAGVCGDWTRVVTAGVLADADLIAIPERASDSSIDREQLREQLLEGVRVDTAVAVTIAGAEHWAPESQLEELLVATAMTLANGRRNPDLEAALAITAMNETRVPFFPSGYAALDDAIALAAKEISAQQIEDDR